MIQLSRVDYCKKQYRLSSDEDFAAAAGLVAVDRYNSLLVRYWIAVFELGSLQMLAESGANEQKLLIHPS